MQTSSGCGRRAGVGVSSSSGNPKFDGAALKHVKRVGKFPRPQRCVMFSKKKKKFLSRRSFSVRIKP